jgi:hypothetical protein
MCFIWVLHMFHIYVASVSSGCCICFQAYVASVSSRCCIYFAMATPVFPSCFRRMLQVFQLFWTYVANVSSRCFKSRSGVPHVVVDPICSSCLSACMRVVVEGAQAADAETVRAQIETERAWDTKRRGTRSGHRTRSSAGPQMK